MRGRLILLPPNSPPFATELRQPPRLVEIFPIGDTAVAYDRRHIACGTAPEAGRTASPATSSSPRAT